MYNINLIELHKDHEINEQQSTIKVISLTPFPSV